MNITDLERAAPARARHRNRVPRHHMSTFNVNIANLLYLGRRSISPALSFKQLTNYVILASMAAIEALKRVPRKWRSADEGKKGRNYGENEGVGVGVCAMTVIVVSPLCYFLDPSTAA